MTSWCTRSLRETASVQRNRSSNSLGFMQNPCSETLKLFLNGFAGEYALLLSIPRTATARALTYCDVFVLARADLVTSSRILATRMIDPLMAS